MFNNKEPEQCFQEKVFSLREDVQYFFFIIFVFVSTTIVLAIAYGLKKVILPQYDLFFLYWQIVLLPTVVVLGLATIMLWLNEKNQNDSTKSKLIITIILVTLGAVTELGNIYSSSLIRIIFFIIWMIILFFEIIKTLILIIKKLTKL